MEIIYFYSKENDASIRIKNTLIEPYMDKYNIKLFCFESFPIIAAKIHSTDRISQINYKDDIEKILRKYYFPEDSEIIIPALIIRNVQRQYHHVYHLSNTFGHNIEFVLNRLGLIKLSPEELKMMKQESGTTSFSAPKITPLVIASNKSRNIPGLFRNNAGTTAYRRCFGTDKDGYLVSKKAEQKMVLRPNNIN